MPTKGNKRQTIRFPPNEERAMALTIKRRNVNSRNRPWDISAFVRAAVSEKIAHMERSRRPRKRKGRSMSQFNVLMYGELSEVNYIVESRDLDNGEIRAVLMNLITHVENLEKSKSGVDERGFDEAWRELEVRGMCDTAGGAEYQRVAKAWTAEGCPRTIHTFIMEHANQPAQRGCCNE